MSKSKSTLKSHSKLDTLSVSGAMTDSQVALLYLQILNHPALLEHSQGAGGAHPAQRWLPHLFEILHAHVPACTPEVGGRKLR